MKYDVATALNQGRRDYQEDCLVADFSIGDPFGFVVLADGMGGHAAGDVASKTVVTEVFSELKFQLADSKNFEKNISAGLIEVVESANECIKAHVMDNPTHKGMGTTLVAPVFFQDRLYWISVGDSPMYRYRKGELEQLNEDHSLAPKIDMMFKSGQIDEETALTHPDRNCLTSALMGDNIREIDCRNEPAKMEKNDIIIVASDGLQFLTNDEISEIVHKGHSKSSDLLAHDLLNAILKLQDPDQDNISLAVVKLL